MAIVPIWLLRYRFLICSCSLEMISSLKASLGKRLNFHILTSPFAGSWLMQYHVCTHVPKLEPNSLTAVLVAARPRILTGVADLIMHQETSVHCSV